MKVAILYIAIGNYEIFWDEFYQSCENLFLQNSEKQYFVFTDAQRLLKQKCDNVEFIYQENMGWPRNTLYRFHMFMKLKSELQKFDYLIFYNANALINTNISEEEILPVNEDFCYARHFNFVGKDNCFFPYERNRKSTAYVEYGRGEDYIQACFLCGKSKAMLTMFECLEKNINIDMQNNIIARWHDESHVNKYLIDKSNKILGVEYICPKDDPYTNQYNAKVYMRIKTDYLPLDKMRMQKQNFITYISNKCVNQMWKIRDGFHYLIKKGNIWKSAR